MSGPLYCSFCHRNQHGVRMIVQGEHGAICNHCIEEVADMWRESASALQDEVRRLGT